MYWGIDFPRNPSTCFLLYCVRLTGRPRSDPCRVFLLHLLHSPRSKGRKTRQLPRTILLDSKTVLSFIFTHLHPRLVRRFNLPFKHRILKFQNSGISSWPDWESTQFGLTPLKTGSFCLFIFFFFVTLSPTPSRLGPERVVFGPTVLDGLSSSPLVSYSNHHDLPPTDYLSSPPPPPRPRWTGPSREGPWETDTLILTEEADVGRVRSFFGSGTTLLRSHSKSLCPLDQRVCFRVSRGLVDGTYGPSQTARYRPPTVTPSLNRHPV